MGILGWGIQTAYTPLPDNATLWKAVEQNFTAGASNSYNSWDFGLNQQVLLVPEADKGVQVVINSRDAMEHPWHLQYVFYPAPVHSICLSVHLPMQIPSG